MKTAPLRKRGYLLLEVLVGGVVVAIGIGTFGAGIIAASNNSARAAKDSVAAQLVTEGIEIMSAYDYANLPVGSDTTPATVENLTFVGQYQRRIFVSTVKTDTEFVNNQDYKIIRVEVEYLAPPTEIRVLDASIRQYDPS